MVKDSYLRNNEGQTCWLFGEKVRYIHFSRINFRWSNDFGVKIAAMIIVMENMKEISINLGSGLSF